MNPNSSNVGETCIIIFITIIYNKYDQIAHKKQAFTHPYLSNCNKIKSKGLPDAAYLCTNTIWDPSRQGTLVSRNDLRISVTDKSDYLKKIKMLIK